MKLERCEVAVAPHYTDKLCPFLIFTLPTPILKSKDAPYSDFDEGSLPVQSRTPASLKDSTLSLRVSSNGLNFHPSASSFLELKKGSSLACTNLPFGLDQDAAHLAAASVSGTMQYANVQ